MEHKNVNIGLRLKELFIDNLHDYFHSSREISSVQIILACSGGRDSQTVLNLTHEVLPVFQSEKLPYTTTVTVAHVNHSMRPDSDEEERFVASRAAEKGFLFVCQRLTSAPSSNVEAWAREQRYKFLNSLSRDDNSVVITAHHLDDQAENLLMRLLNGRLVGQLGRIKARDFKRRLLRPLLGCTRAEIDRYVALRQIPTYEDQSNLDTRYLRNYVRHRLLEPAKQYFGPGVVRTIARSVDRLAEDEEFIESQVQRLLEIGLDRQRFIELPQALRWRYLKGMAYLQFGETSLEVSQVSWRSLADEIEEKGNRKTTTSKVPNKPWRFITALNEAVRFIADPEKVESPLRGVGESEIRWLSLNASEQFNWGADDGFAAVFDISARIWNCSYPGEEPAFHGPRNSSRLKSDREFFLVPEILLSRFYCRAVRPGDRMEVFRRGNRRIAELFKEFAVPSALRQGYPLVCLSAQTADGEPEEHIL
ncbi:MAG: tRNA lysidine(34) synthetase TilS [bacterium]|nr:tRNA lysidine(34) synthetase TilS [bacterium]